MARTKSEIECEDLPLPLAHVGDKKVKRFHSIGRLPYMRATVTVSSLSGNFACDAHRNSIRILQLGGASAVQNATWNFFDTTKYGAGAFCLGFSQVFP